MWNREEDNNKEEIYSKTMQSMQVSCADPKNLVRGGPTLMVFFLREGGVVDESRDDQNTTKRGPSLK